MLTDLQQLVKCDWRRLHPANNVSKSQRAPENQRLGMWAGTPRFIVPSTQSVPRAHTLSCRITVKGWCSFVLLRRLRT